MGNGEGAGEGDAVKGGIFLVGDGGKLAPMQEAQYVNEAELQNLAR